MLTWPPARPYDHKLWQALCDQGWLGVALPEDQGGLGLGWVEAAVLCEEIGRHTAPVPYLPSLVALTVLSESGAVPRRLGGRPGVGGADRLCGMEPPPDRRFRGPFG